MTEESNPAEGQTQEARDYEADIRKRIFEALQDAPIDASPTVVTSLIMKSIGTLWHDLETERNSQIAAVPYSLRVNKRERGFTILSSPHPDTPANPIGALSFQVIHEIVDEKLESLQDGFEFKGVDLGDFIPFDAKNGMLNLPDMGEHPDGEVKTPIHGLPEIPFTKVSKDRQKSASKEAAKGIKYPDATKDTSS